MMVMMVVVIVATPVATPVVMVVMVVDDRRIVLGFDKSGSRLVLSVGQL